MQVDRTRISLLEATCQGSGVTGVSVGGEVSVAVGISVGVDVAVGVSVSVGEGEAV